MPKSLPPSHAMHPRGLASMPSHFKTLSECEPRRPTLLQQQGMEKTALDGPVRIVNVVRGSLVREKTVRENCPGKNPEKRRTRKTVWRRGRDSNPGSPFLRTHLISNQALSAAQPPLRPCQNHKDLQRSLPAYRRRARDSPAWSTAKNSKSLVHRQARRPVPEIQEDYSGKRKEVTGYREQTS